MRSRLLLLALLACVVSALQGCDHKELCYDHEHIAEVALDFDWSLSPEAGPKSMVVRVFRLDGSAYQRYEFGDRNGGSIRFEAREYRIICHNGSLDALDEAGRKWDEYGVECIPQNILSPMGRDSGAPRPPGTDEQPVVCSPDMFWTDFSEYVDIKPFVKGQRVSLRPVEATVDCSIEIDNVENLEESPGVSAALSGMSGRYNIVKGTDFGSPVTMPIALTPEGTDRLVANFKLFGHCPAGEGRHILTIYTYDKHYFNFDVTEQVHSASDPHNIIIKIDHLKLPEPAGTDMAPSISDWEDGEEVNIDMH